MNCSDVLIIGAGPTGLVLALWLRQQGVKVRIIDKTRPGHDLPGPGGAGTDPSSCTASWPDPGH